MRAMIVAALIASSASGCGAPDPRKDLPDTQVDLDENRRDVYVNPDQFPNVVAFCDGDTRLYVTTRDYAPIVVVADSPECGE